MPSFYTDGSRQSDEVVATALLSLKSRLPDESSIFSAEYKALLLDLTISMSGRNIF